MSLPTVTATNVHVVNLDTDEVYYTKGTGSADSWSVAKLMTAYIVRQNKTLAELTSETTTLVSGDIIDGSTFQTGDVVRLLDLLLFAMVSSQNTAAQALARVIGNGLSGGGGVTRFVTEMATQATNLGLTGSTFATPYGGETTSEVTPADVCKLIATFRNDAVLLDIWRWTRARITVTRGSATVLTGNGTNDMHADVGVIGGKTGTNGGGTVANLALLWEAPNGQLIAACTLGSTSDANRYVDMRAIIAELPIDFTDLATPGTPFTPAYLFNTLGWSGGWWDPTDTSHMWQDAAGTTPVSSAGHPVGRWEPKAGDATPWLQSTSGNRPLWQTNELTCDGSNDHMTYANQTIGTTGLFADSSQKFIVAHRFRGTTGTGVSKAGATGSGRTFQIYLDSGAAPAIYFRGSTTSVETTFADNTTRSMHGWWDGAEAGMDRGGLGSAKVAVGTASQETQNIIWGARTGGTGFFLNGAMRHIVITDDYNRDAFRRLRDWFNGGTINAFADAGGGGGSPTFKFWSVPTSSVNGTVAELAIMSDDRLTVVDLVEATVVNGAFVAQCTNQSQVTGTKRFTVLHNWNGSMTSSSILGGLGIAEVIEE